jgi:hypothetical protein
MKYNFYNRDIEKIHEEVCIPAFEKYYKIYSDLYGYKYTSPNKTNNSSDYGQFWDLVNFYLKRNNYIYDCKYPGPPHLGMYLNNCHISGKDKFYNNTLLIKSKKIFYLDNSLSVPKVSKIIKDLFNTELHNTYIESKIENFIKRFFILGGIGEYELIIDNIYKYGFNYCEKHTSEKKWSQIYKDLLMHHSGEYGIMKNFHKVINANLKTNEGKTISLPLAGFRDEIEESSVNRRLEQFIKEQKEKGVALENRTIEFFRNVLEKNEDNYNQNEKLFNFIIWNEFDNIQYHEIVPIKFYNEFIDTFKNPENLIRETLGLPKIGEGWINETKLFYLIKERFKEYRVIQHGKPNWLGKQHLDIYLPDFNIGIEYQGEQHSISVEIFGGEEGLTSNKERDERKRRLCKKNNLKLFEVYPKDNFEEFINQLSNLYLK